VPSAFSFNKRNLLSLQPHEVPDVGARNCQILSVLDALQQQGYLQGTSLASLQLLRTERLKIKQWLLDNYDVLRGQHPGSPNKTDYIAQLWDKDKLPPHTEKSPARQVTQADWKQHWMNFGHCTAPLAQMGDDFSLLALSSIYSCNIHVTTGSNTYLAPNILTVGNAQCDIHIAHYHVPSYMHFASTRPINAAIGGSSGGRAEAASSVDESSTRPINAATGGSSGGRAEAASGVDESSLTGLRLNADMGVSSRGQAEAVSGGAEGSPNDLIHEGPKQVLQLRLGTPACPWAGRPRANVIAARLFAALLWPVARFLRQYNHGHGPTPGGGGASLGPGDLNVTSCMTPKVRSLDGAARALLCVELKPCRLHVRSAPKPSKLLDLQKRRDRSDEGGD
jgi:hypothetical protein